MLRNGHHRDVMSGKLGQTRSNRTLNWRKTPGVALMDVDGVSGRYKFAHEVDSGDGYIFAEFVRFSHLIHPPRVSVDQYRRLFSTAGSGC